MEESTKSLQTQIAALEEQNKLLLERLERIENQNGYLRQLVDAIPVHIYVKDYDGVYVLANQASAEFYGLQPDDLVGKTDLELGMPQEQYETVRKIIRETINKGEISPSGEITVNHPLTGEVGYYDGINVPIKVDSETHNQLVGISFDVTQRRLEQAEHERLQQEIIEAQKKTLHELSTPIIPLFEGVLVMPLIGSIDTARARDIMRNLLSGITEYRAKTIIIDITGVPVVDSGVADHLNKTIQAARLKGAHTIVTGISDAVAETIVDLGIDWNEVQTMRDLQAGLFLALEQIGKQLS